MGTESSKLLDLEVTEENVEVTDGWALHKGKIGSVNPQAVSVFRCVAVNEFEKNSIPLECYAKRLLMYRHPAILKFISSWRSKDSFYLVTEEVKPLVQVLDCQSHLQICVGLHNILKAINFLHEKAQASHNNICRAAIYVTCDGTWKLGGFEHVYPFSKMTKKYLLNSRKRRYERAISPEEDSTECIRIPTSVDQFAFGVLVDEVLSNEKEDEVPVTAEFRKAGKQLQNAVISSRPTLAELLNHDYFTQDFIKVYSFLVELPLKAEEEKKAFFSSLIGQLLNFPENLIATQLSSLLLARLVLLDETAQKFLLPHILHPRKGLTCHEDNVGLLSEENYRQHIVPRLLQMLCVHDAQIRLILLKHFKYYMYMFSSEELKCEVLPELLVGIKDTNDYLVVATLHALAELVPVLGAATVIGGKRARFFTDGRPKMVEKVPVPAVDLPVTKEESCNVDLAERPSPDGGEDQSISEEETGIWSDWENSDTKSSDISKERPGTSSNKQSTLSGALNDITSLDIKNMTSKKEDVDFFEDMVPVISKPPVAEVEQINLSELKGEPVSMTKPGKFIMDMSENTRWLEEETVEGQHEGDGWEVDLEEWGDSDS